MTSPLSRPKARDALLLWDAIAADEAIMALSALLRERWRVFIGLLDEQARVVPLGAALAPVAHSACTWLKANPIDNEGCEDRLSCSRSMRQWLKLGLESVEAVSEATCHAELSALLLPLRLAPASAPLGRCGALYLSGFIRREREREQVVALERRLEQAGVEASERERQIQEMPRYGAGEIAALKQDAETLHHLIVRSAPWRRGVAAALKRAERGGHASAPASSFCGMLGQSASMRRLFDLIERIAPTRSTVLILGENGTGKELVARALHAMSRRRDKPYVVQNCAAIPSNLIESELFGHKRGAFSGAHRDRQGLFEAANQGTFFLDEIGEMDISLQAKMLRVVQEGTFLPVGESSHRQVDVRLIFATNRDLRRMVEERDFRQDLFFRINVITLEVPPLRERREDIALLLEHFLLKSVRRHGLGPKRLSPQCVQQLTAYDWPGNVRELENEVERMAILSGSQVVIDQAMLSGAIEAVEPLGLFQHLGEMTMPDAVEQLERQMIAASLGRHDFNKTRAAKELGVSRRNLIRKVSRYELDRDDGDQGGER